MHLCIRLAKKAKDTPHPTPAPHCQNQVPAQLETPHSCAANPGGGGGVRLASCPHKTNQNYLLPVSLCHFFLGFCKLGARNSRLAGIGVVNGTNFSVSVIPSCISGQRGRSTRTVLFPVTASEKASTGHEERNFANKPFLGDSWSQYILDAQLASEEQTMQTAPSCQGVSPRAAGFPRATEHHGHSRTYFASESTCWVYLVLCVTSSTVGCHQHWSPR